MEECTLDVWKGDWGLASVDAECLHVLTYAKFSGAPLKINPLVKLYRTPNGRLPVLRNGSVTLDSPKDIIAYLREHHYNIDQANDREQCGRIMAYETMFKEELFPALQFIWWIDKKNVDELVRPWYCKELPFPFNFYYPGKFERQARSMFETLYPTEDNIEVVENKVYSQAQKCVTLISSRLGDSEYFFGQQPCEIDAIIYSYLAPLLKAPLPNAALQHHLKACTNLVKYISRITQRYFANEYRDYENYKAEENAEKLRRDSESDFPNKRRNQLLAGVFAALAMAGYAFSTGMVEVPIKDDESSDVTEEYVSNAEDYDTE